MVRNLLNNTRGLTFKLQATICREVAFCLLSPLPLSIGDFTLYTFGQAFLKLLNPTARDLSYTVSAQQVTLFLQDSDIPAAGYEAVVEIRRARETSSALRPDEREHLESSVSFGEQNEN